MCVWVCGSEAITCNGDLTHHEITQTLGPIKGHLNLITMLHLTTLQWSTKHIGYAQKVKTNKVLLT